MANFLNVYHDFNVMNIESLNFLKHFLNNLFLQPAIGLSLLSAQTVSSVKDNS